MRTLLGTILLLVVFSALACAQPTRVIGAKKFICYGMDTLAPTPAYTAQNIRQMEKRPFDGIVLSLASKRGGKVFMGGKWDAADLAADTQAMQRIRWGTFKSNFLTLYAVSDQDWFSDADWANVINNVEIMARCAKAGGCNLAFDAEPYGPSPWDYAKQTHARDKSFAEYAVKVRERGRQFMEAIGRIIPDNVMLTCFTYTVHAGLAGVTNRANRDAALSRFRYGLYLPFLNGMLDGLSPQMVLCDGNEDSYYYYTSQEYLNARERMRQGVLSLIPPELVHTFQTNTQASHGLFLEHFGGLRRMTTEELAKNFEFNTYWALKTADEFVWCFNERLDWWKTTGVRKDTDVPQWMDQAITNARAAIAADRPCPWDAEIKALIESQPSWFDEP